MGHHRTERGSTMCGLDTRAVRAVGKIWAARLYGHYSSKRGAWHKILRRAQFRRRIKAIRMRTLPTWNRSTRTLTVNVKTSPLAYSRHAELFALQRLTPRSRLPALVSRVPGGGVERCRAVSRGVEDRCRVWHLDTDEHWFQPRWCRGVSRGCHLSSWSSWHGVSSCRVTSRCVEVWC